MAAFEGISLDDVKIARGGDRVYKDECIYSFDTPECEGGIYVSLRNLLGVSQQWLEFHHRKTGDPIYLHIKRVELPKEKEEVNEGAEPPEKKPTRLAIGVEGGFTGGIEKVEYKDVYEVVLLPQFTTVSWPSSEIPQKIRDCVHSIINAESASQQDAVATWEAEGRKVSKHASNLQQLDNGVKVPPSGWKCEKCDLATNLWLNLTDGSILCGRRYFDGSGGNNHAVEHYEQVKYPLAVKLGTITGSGGDVHSYDEDDMVEDPNLGEHLAHFGINMMAMSKTDKTMTELEIDMNMRIGEWTIIQESGRELKLVYGPGYTGLQNMGNTCYLNSVMQVLFSLPEFQNRYFETAVKTFENASNDFTGDFNAQMCKLAMGLLSGQYSKPLEGRSSNVGGADEAPGQREQKGIRPSMFKTLIGRGHREFSSNRQQDAQEFFLHLLSLMERAEHACPGAMNVGELFKYQVEERLQCSMSKKVQYTVKPDLILTLPVPIDLATNKAEVAAWVERKAQLQAEKKRVNPEDVVRSKVPFSLCLAKYGSPADIPDFYSTALQKKSHATRTYRFQTFPKYLMIQLAKFSLDQNWVPIKYDVEVDFPDQLDLNDLRANGLQPGEEELPQESGQTQEPAFEIDEGIVMQLVSMGFNIEGCKRAVYHTKNNGAEAAMNWVLEHMGDPDFESPFVPPQPSTSSSSSSEAGAVSEESIMIIMSLGFTREQATRALKATGNSVDRAADWVFSHMDELQEPEPQATPQESGTKNDGSGKYELLAFISHMGSSTSCGHYVCHIRKEGKWIIYNDNKVAESVAPPKDLGYLYLYRRLD